MGGQKRYWSGLLLTLILLLLSCGSPPRPATPPATAVGLNAQFFAGSGFSGPALERLEPRLALAGAVPGLRPGPSSARYQGFLVAPAAGAYTLHLGGQGQARLFLDGRLVAQALPVSVKLNLHEGQRLGLRVEYQATGPAQLRLEWEGPGLPRQAVPPYALRPAQEPPHQARAQLTPQAVSRGWELLWNPGFEQGSRAWVELAGGALSLIPGRQGGQALQAQGWTYAAQTLPWMYVQVGPTYTLEGWARSPQGVACVIGVKGGDASAITFDYPLGFSGPDWQQRARSFTLPAGTLWAEAYVQAQAGPGQGCEFDDLSLFAGDKAPLPPAPELLDNRLQNPGFEQSLTSWTLATGSAQPGADGRNGAALAYQAWSWVYQIVPLSGLSQGERLVLKGWVQNPDNQACTLGLQGGTETALTFDQPVHYRALEWREVYTEVSLPPGTTWLGAYLAGSAGCRFDDLQLGVPTTPQGVTPQIQLEAPITFAGGGFNFDAYGSGPPGSTYAWNFGDGTTGQGEAVYKTYSQPGYYDVTLTVTAPTGVSSSQTVRVAVLPEIHRIPATRATTGDSITFDVQYPLPGYTYRHSFSDGTSLEGPRVSKTFSNLGFYDYTLTILENGSIPPQSMGSRAAAQNAGARVVAVQRSRVNVWKPRPVARLTANVLAGNAPLTVGFSALGSTGSTALDYSWDFGDGTTSTLAQPSKTYTSQGRYLVSLTVTDQKGQSDTEQTFIIVRDPGVNITLNVNYPAITGQSLSAPSEPGSDFTPRRAEAGRTPATGEVRAQNTSEYLNFFPYAFPSQNAQLRASIRGYNNTKLIRPGVIARWNGFEEAPGFSWDLFCPTDPDICDVAFFNPGYFVPILNTNLFTFINVSQVFQIEYNIFRGLRVPRVMVSVLPDEQLPGDLASPFVRENTVEVGGRTELFLQVYVRASEAQSGLVSFEVPVYAVNNAGQRLANINGIFKARFKNVQSEPGDGVMVAGRSSIRVTVPIASYANAQNRFDLTQIEVYANPACGPDTTYSTTLRSHLNGCAQVTASHEAPGNNAAVQAYPYRLPADFQDRINRIFVGATPEARQAYDNNLKDLPGSVARFVIGFIPILGDSIDLVEQAYNAALGNNLDPVLTTLAAAGLGLDLISGGAGDLTAIFKGVYRLSLETGGLLAQAIRAQLTGVINGSINARQFVDNLAARFAKVTELGRTPQCGLLGLDCIGKYDAVAKSVKDRDGLADETALRRLDGELDKSNRQNISAACYFTAITTTTLAGNLDLVEAGQLLLGLSPLGTGGQSVQSMPFSSKVEVLAAPNRCNFVKFNRDIARTYAGKYAARGISEADLKRAKPHHIVPLTYQDARKCESRGQNVCDEARRILARAGLDLNNPANGVLLPDRRGQLTTFDAAYPNATEHCCMHTREYFERVFRKLKDVENRFSSNPALFAQKVREELEQMADELLAGSFR